MPALQDLTGRRFGRLVAQSMLRTPGGIYWSCICDCGKEQRVRSGNLTSGATNSCGCLRRESAAVIGMEGQKFGRFTVLARAASSPNDRIAMWLCRCECGTEVTVRGVNLRNGNSKSCGCLKIDRVRETHTTHGRSRSALHRRWTSMKSRCHNPNDPRYADYGGRGIYVCEEWRDSFEVFRRDVGEPPPGMSLDRTDNDGPYAPWNVRWATRSQQQANKRPYPAMTLRSIRHLRRLGWTVSPPPGEPDVDEP